MDDITVFDTYPTLSPYEMEDAMETQYVQRYHCRGDQSATEE